MKTLVEQFRSTPEGEAQFQQAKAEYEAEFSGSIGGLATMNEGHSADIGEPIPAAGRLRESDRPIVPSLYQEKGQRVPKDEMPMFNAAIRVALREYHVARMLPLDFTHKQVTDFADSVLSNWSMAITAGDQS